MKHLSMLLLLIGLTACTTPKSYKQSYEQKVQAANIYIQLGYTYLKQKKFARAKQKLLQAEALYPDSSEVHSALGYYFQAVGEKQLAHHHYLMSIQLSQHSGESLNNYGTFLCHIGRHEESVNYFVRAAETHGYLKASNAYENAGVCAELAGKSVAAEHYFHKSLQHDPENNSALLALSKISSARKEFSKANTYLERFLEQSTPTEEAMQLGMQISAGLKDFGALKYFSDAYEKLAN